MRRDTSSEQARDRQAPSKQARTRQTRSEQARTRQTRSRRKRSQPADDGLGAELRAHGLRATTTRRLILSALRADPFHPTADELHAALQLDDHSIGVATLYQNLVRLVDVGLLTRFRDSRGLLRFDANLTPHHHLFCTSCGRIVDVTLDDQASRRLDRVGRDLACEHGEWTLDTAKLELRGLCPVCRSPARESEDGESRPAATSHPH